MELRTGSTRGGAWQKQAPGPLGLERLEPRRLLSVAVAAAVHPQSKVVAAARLEGASFNGPQSTADVHGLQQEADARDRSGLAGVDPSGGSRANSLKQVGGGATETAANVESADAKGLDASSQSGEGSQGAASSASVASVSSRTSGTNDAGGNSGGESDQNEHSSGVGSSEHGPASQSGEQNSGSQDIGQQSPGERNNGQKNNGQQNSGGPTSPDVPQGLAANREAAAAGQETQAGESPSTDSPAPSRAPSSGGNASNSGASGLGGTNFSSGREVRLVVLAEGGTEATSAARALRIVLESKSPERGPMQAASPGYGPAAVGRLEIATPSASALEMVERILPQLSGLAAIPRLVPLNALNGFADAIAGFAHESAELGTMLAMTHSHQFAWTVTSVVLAADTVLIGCWCAARRKHGGPVERGRFPFSLRRIKS